MRTHRLNINFFHIYPQGIPSETKVVTLLALHSWPGSPLEFYEMIPTLIKKSSNHSFVFEVIIPFLPGFGMSDAPQKSGFDVIQMAIVLNNFMKRINAENYYIYGGDPGFSIAKAMAALFPDNVLGIHSSFCHINTQLAALKTVVGSFWPGLILDHDKIDYYYPMKPMVTKLLKESSFYHLQTTKPDTLGILLSRNPVGQLAYAFEMFSSLSNAEKPGGNLDRLLDIMTVNYASDAANTAFRLYKESVVMSPKLDTIKSKVPLGCARFKSDIFHQPNWVLQDKFTNIVHSTYHEHGGHFPTLEVPFNLVEDIYKFVEILESKTVETEIFH